MIEDREPKWTETLKKRKGDETTFKQCGWCEHNGGGSYRYNCMLNGSCNLLPSYDEENDELQFDTPCRVIGKGKEDIERFIGSHESEIKDAKGTIEREKGIIVVLNKLLKTAKNIPPLPWNRKHDHFNIGDKVAVYHQNDGEWKFGTVVMGYRHHDGCVSFHLDGTPNPTYNYLEPTIMEPGDGITPKMVEKMNKDSVKLVKSIGKLANSPGCGMSVPTIMLMAEYKFFASFPEEWKRWENVVCSKDYNGNKIEINTAPK